MRVAIETKNILRKRIKKCDICGCKRLRFEYDEYIDGLVWVRCKHCERVLYLGPGAKQGVRRNE